jgi:hypothetical protein
MDSIEKPEVNAVCLQNAVLCADCEVISDSPNDTCRVCGSHSLLSLSYILGGAPPTQSAGSRTSGVTVYAGVPDSS